MPEDSTSADLSELVRRFAEAYNRSDFDALSSLLSPDVVYRPLATFTETQECRGLDECRRFFEGFLEVWADDFAARVDTTRVYGDTVIARVAFTGHARASGVEVSGRTFSMFRFHDCLLTRIEDFVDRDDALKALEASG
jgi:ketosteroid isomerase-like protein